MKRRLGDDAAWVGSMGRKRKVTLRALKDWVKVGRRKYEGRAPRTGSDAHGEIFLASETNATIPQRKYQL